MPLIEANRATTRLFSASPFCYVLKIPPRKEKGDEAELESTVKHNRPTLCQDDARRRGEEDASSFACFRTLHAVSRVQTACRFLYVCTSSVRPTTVRRCGRSENVNQTTGRAELHATRARTTSSLTQSQRGNTDVSSRRFRDPKLLFVYLTRQSETTFYLFIFFLISVSDSTARYIFHIGDFSRTRSRRIRKTRTADTIDRCNSVI